MRKSRIDEMVAAWPESEDPHFHLQALADMLDEEGHPFGQTLRNPENKLHQDYAHWIASKPQERLYGNGASSHLSHSPAASYHAGGQAGRDLMSIKEGSARPERFHQYLQERTKR